MLARLIDEHPGFDPRAWMQRLPTLDLFAALVFQVIGQQISVAAALAIFARLVEHLGAKHRTPMTSQPSLQRRCARSDCLAERQTRCWNSRGGSETADCRRP